MIYCEFCMWSRRDGTCGIYGTSDFPDQCPDQYEPPPRYVPAEPYDSAYREKEALEAMGYRVP